MKIKFPKLYSLKKVGTKSIKNTIRHLIAPSVARDCNLTPIDKTSYLLKDDNGTSYLVSSEKKVSNTNYKYILLAEKFKSINISESDVSLRSWLKHPDLVKISPNEIIKSWNNTFKFKKEDSANNILGLRLPQIGAIHSILGHLTMAKEISTVVLPTGTGKTETMLSILIANPCEKLLVTVPSDSLRQQLTNKFLNLGLLKIEDVNGDSIASKTAKYPIIGTLNTGFENKDDLNSFLNECNVVITTMNLVSGFHSSFQKILSNSFSHLFVDEAHHSKAGKWNSFISRFNKSKVVQFTATPYRNDGQLLDGKIIYNFTLEEAQKQGYFKTIDFLPIREYETNLSDQKIATVAINRLREDLSKGFDHILMARCENKTRAEEVYKIYQKYDDLNPILLHSSILKKREVKEQISNKEHRIIVCVDMLGEGFDLPELKIAAFHDIRKSLPITLQFAGRFTRTSRDSHLGNASFVANLYQPSISDELGLLYFRDSNWNSILPNLSQQATQEQLDLQSFLSDFEQIEESVIPYQDIKPAYSVVAYKNQTNEWFPLNFSKGIKGYDNFEHKFYDINRKATTLVIFLGKRKTVDWGNFRDIYNTVWNIFIIYWEQKNNILFIHSSEKGSEFKELAKAIIGESAKLIKNENVFKSFYDVERVKLYNVGLRKGLGKNITFQSYYGKGVQEALSIAEEKSGVSNNVFGVGFNKGVVTSIGCSRKGRIWSYSRGTIDQFLKWCDELAEKLSNKSIDPYKILLRNAIKPKQISTRPNLYNTAVDWNPLCLKELESKIEFRIDNNTYDFANSSLHILSPESKNELMFSLKTIDGKLIDFSYYLTHKMLNNEKEFSYSVQNTSGTKYKVFWGSKVFESIESFFEEFPPMFWFADGSYLLGNEYIRFNEDIQLFPKENLISWDWNGVSKNKESEHFQNIRKDSIQYFCIEKLKLEDNDIIYNDDNSGEIADIVTLSNVENYIRVQFYHLKFASEGKVTNQIKNFYEVCGQTQKSLIWKFREGHEFINHLIRREIKKNKIKQTRIRKGKMEDLEIMLEVAKKTKPLKFEMFIIQPGASKSSISDEILTLLGVTSNHLKKEGDIDLKVIISP